MPRRYSDPREWFHETATRYVVAQVLFHLAQTGVVGALVEGGPATPDEIATRLKLVPHVVRTLLEYLWMTDEILEKDAEGRFRVSEFGRKVLEKYSRPGPSGRIYNLFKVRVGAYEPVWRSLGGMMDGSLRYGKEVHRNGEIAADAVYNFSGFGLPTFEQAIREFRPSHLVELGTTSSIPSGLAGKFPDVRFCGIDRNPETLRTARSMAEASGASKVEWIQADIHDVDAWASRLAGGERPMFFSFHFHEFLSAGDDRVVGLLRELKTRFPGGTVIMLEEPRLPDSEKESADPIYWLYMASNFLIHHLIGNGKILTEAEWLKLAVDGAGCRLVRIEQTGIFGMKAFVLGL